MTDLHSPCSSVASRRNDVGKEAFDKFDDGDTDFMFRSSMRQQWNVGQIWLIGLQNSDSVSGCLPLGNAGFPFNVTMKALFPPRDDFIDDKRRVL